MRGRQGDGGAENVKNNQFCVHYGAFDSAAMPPADAEILLCALRLIFFTSQTLQGQHPVCPPP